MTFNFFVIIKINKNAENQTNVNKKELNSFRVVPNHQKKDSALRINITKRSLILFRNWLMMPSVMNMII